MSVYMCIRPHGESSWDGYQSAILSGLRVTSVSVPMPEAKTEYAEVYGMHGSLDYAEFDGEIYYKNRSISVSCEIIPSGGFDFAAFVSKYHGRLCDIVFAQSVSANDYYYTGRLSVSALPRERVNRTLELTLNAEPFRRPVAGTTSVTLSRTVSKDFLVDDGALNTDIMTFEEGITVSQVIYVEDGAITVSLDDGDDLLVTVDIPAGTYTLSSESCPDNAYFCVYYGGQSTKVSRSSVAFTVTANTVTRLYFKNTNLGRRLIKGIKLMQQPPAPVEIDVGDKACCPCFSPALAVNTTVFVNSKRLGTFAKGTSWSPYFELPCGKSTVYLSADSAGTETLTFEKAVF